MIAAIALVGCDRLTGAADQKILDAQAIGYACRVSMKVPEECMQANESYSPTYVLNGWKIADRDINERVIDPSMGKRVAAAPASTAVPKTAPAAATPAMNVPTTTATKVKPAISLPKIKSLAPNAATPGSNPPPAAKDEHVKPPAH